MCLAMVTADGSERLFPLTLQRVVVGRNIGCDLRVPLPSVAERHCEIVQDGTVLTVRDLGSDGGTVHNGSPVKHATLALNDTLTIGPVTFVVRAEERSPGTVAEFKPQAPRATPADTSRDGRLP